MEGTPRILAFVLAGGEGKRLRPLTVERPKPALPFVDGVHIIDFVLSNLLNSGVRSVYVLAQYKPQSLTEHLETSWDEGFRRRGGFLRTVVAPSEGDLAFKGTADAVRKNLKLVEAHAPDLVAVFAADHVYRMDLRQMADFHCRRKAEVSIAATPVPLAAASSFGVIVADQRGRILSFEEKPEHPTPVPGDPTHAYASMGNYLFEPGALLELLGECDRTGGTDFGYHVMPRLPHRTRAYAYDFSGNRIPGLRPWEEHAYWRDVGTPECYRAAQRDVAGARPRLELANACWPVHGASMPRRLPSRSLPEPAVPVSRTPDPPAVHPTAEEIARA
jgi:glucose-1-phosphate adenylyltransferase